MRMDKGKPFMHVEEDGGSAPTFSEAFLYDAVGKDEARFVLGVAEEYEHVIAALGPAAIRAILDVRPGLVQRLGTGAKVVEWLEDARSEQGSGFDSRFPPQVILDEEAAKSVWNILHSEYRRYFNPEEAMDRDALRTYHLLTDALGEYEKRERAKEIARLPEKLERQRQRREEIAAKRRERADIAP